MITTVFPMKIRYSLSHYDFETDLGGGDGEAMALSLRSTHILSQVYGWWVVPTSNQKKKWAIYKVRRIPACYTWCYKISRLSFKLTQSLHPSFH